MGIQITPDEVNKYLIKIKKALSANRYQFIERRKNIDAMSRVGILPSHTKEIILGLTYKNYLSGPEPERDKRFSEGEYMLFGCEVSGLEFFVKIKIMMQDGEDFCRCISFHDPEKKNYYPYK